MKLSCCFLVGTCFSEAPTSELKVSAVAVSEYTCLFIASCLRYAEKFLGVAQSCIVISAEQEVERPVSECAGQRIRRTVQSAG